MPLKFKIIFYNLMLFLIIFDVIYLIVWVLSIEMNPIKAILVAGFTALLMPWAKATNLQTGKKVNIRSYVFVLYKKYRNH